MYQTTLVNFGSTYTFATRECALKSTKEMGYEAIVQKNNRLIASYSHIGGWKFYAN